MSNIQILNMSPSLFKFVECNNLGAARQAARWPQAIALLQPDSEIQGWATDLSRETLKHFGVLTDITMATISIS